jgi:hypothetical protein
LLAIRQQGLAPPLGARSVSAPNSPPPEVIRFASALLLEEIGISEFCTMAAADDSDLLAFLRERLHLTPKDVADALRWLSGYRKQRRAAALRALERRRLATADELRAMTTQGHG